MPDLSIYIHIPFCRRRCGYCSFVSSAGREKDIPAYVGALVAEIGLRRRLDMVVRTIYLGGGTPSLLEPSQIEDILEAIRDNYAVRYDAEITLEANPGTVDGDYLRDVRLAGVNRLSLGVQSLDDDELAMLGRLHNASEARQAVSWARAAGFDNLSLDFIYGVPGRSVEKWREMLGEITGMGAEHLSLYALTLEEGTAMAEAVARGEIAAPDPDAAAQEYEMAGEALEGAGYRQYEISNWARPGFESRHNMAYWTGEPYLGLGCGAHSFIDGERRANTGDLDGYMRALGEGHLPEQTAEKLDERTALGEAMMLGLRLNRGVLASDIGARFDIDLREYFKAEIEELTALGLLEAWERGIRLTARGRLLGNEVFLRFMP